MRFGKKREKRDCEVVVAGVCARLRVCVCVWDTEVWGVVCHSGPLLSTASVSQNPIRSKSHLGGTFIMDPAHSDCCYEYN